ncbi:MAG: ABC transporter ATP-binding protein [Planctomycetota bacterium]
MSSGTGERRTIVRLRNVHKAFGDKKVLQGVDLDVHKSEILVILGRSGGGKSVTLKTICGLLRPEQGEVACWKDDVLSLNEKELRRLRRRISYVFQHGALLNWMTAAENIALPLIENRTCEASEVDDRVQQALEQVDLPDAGPRFPDELSGGMRKRVALARSIAQEPNLLLYDEPTTGLDPITTSTIDNLVKSTRNRLGLTSVVISHDLESAFRIADRIAMLHEGKIIECTEAAAFRESNHPVVRRFLEAEPELSADVVRIADSGVIATPPDDPERSPDA